MNLATGVAIAYVISDSYSRIDGDDSHDLLHETCYLNDHSVIWAKSQTAGFYVAWYGCNGMVPSISLSRKSCFGLGLQALLLDVLLSVFT